MGWPEEEEIDPALFMAEDLPEERTAVQIQTVVQQGIREIGGGERVNPEQEGERRVYTREAQDTEESVSYRVRYVLPERNRMSGEVRKMLQSDLVKRFDRETETTVTARYQGDQEDDFTYLQIDVSRMPAGVHRLIVKVRDLYTGQTVEREALFRVIE